MGLVRVNLVKQDCDLRFRAFNIDGLSIDIDDATASEDGQAMAWDRQLLVMAIGGCSGIDIMSILKKSRQQVTRFDIDVVGEKPDGVSPSIFQTIHIS